MQKIVPGVLFICLFFLAPASAEIFRLFGGAEVRGELLKEKPDAYVVDLGYDVLVLPKEHVLETLAEEKERSESDAGPVFKDLFESAAGGPLLRVESLVKRVGEAVVEVRTRSGLGSGFIIHPDGFLITNHHVIAGDTKLVVTIFRRKGRNLEKVQHTNVQIVAMDPARDLALLKIEPKEDGASFEHVMLGDSDKLVQGQQVFAVGSPLGFERTVSKGIVSVPARVMGKSAILTQTTAQINPGNSGGPLFDLHGHVIGVNDMKIAAVGVEGVGFAIPTSVVKMFLTKRDAFAFDPRNPNAGYKYFDPPGKAAKKSGADETKDPSGSEEATKPSSGKN